MLIPQKIGVASACVLAAIASALFLLSTTNGVAQDGNLEKYSPWSSNLDDPSAIRIAEQLRTCMSGTAHPMSCIDSTYAECGKTHTQEQCKYQEARGWEQIGVQSLESLISKLGTSDKIQVNQRHWKEYADSLCSFVSNIYEDRRLSRLETAICQQTQLAERAIFLLGIEVELSE